MSDSQSTVELFRSSLEVEALGIEAELRAHGIEPITEHRASTAYPGLVDRGIARAIHVRAADATRARAILESWLAERDAEPIDEEELARAAMEADDADPDELARRRAELDRADRGGAYRRLERRARADERAPERRGGRLLALVIASVAAIAALVELAR